jgi:hypothetical protein
MIAWREKLVACAIHFLATLLLAALAAALIFLVWFPAPFARMLGGNELFLLVVGCDLALGPLISLVIYNSRKSRRELITDYSIVGLVQIAAVVYGIWIMAGTRPVYVAFVQDRFEIVQAADLKATELAAANDSKYASKPLTGPRLISVVVPPAEAEAAMFQSLEGNEEHQRPRFYMPIEAELPAIQKRAKKLEDLAARFKRSQADIDRAQREAGIPPEHQRWLPVRHSKGFWTAVIDVRTGIPVSYIELDPY